MLFPSAVFRKFLAVERGTIGGQLKERVDVDILLMGWGRLRAGMQDWKMRTWKRGMEREGYNEREYMLTYLRKTAAATFPPVTVV